MWGVARQRIAIFLLLALITGALSSKPPPLHGGIDGGIPCAGCTFGIGLAEQMAQIYNETITQSLDRLCDLLPMGNFSNTCREIVDFFGPIIINLWYMKETPDVMCQLLKLCYTEPKKEQCHLFPLPQEGISRRIEKHKSYVDAHLEKNLVQRGLKDISSICDLPGMKLICDLFDRFVDRHEPVVDFDGDFFSTFDSLRGSDWRGKDCNDYESSHHPGAKPIDSDVETDSNCNGIYGQDKQGTPYEDLFCKDFPHLGVATLGDSAAAHFHIPEEWLMVNKLSKEMLSHLPYVAENEFDWPMMSGTTGFKNITWPIISGPVHSIYQRMRERNHCIHRDYQNIGVNGADSFNVLANQYSLARDMELDLPVLLSYQLVGNDVCNRGYEDTLAHMTTPQQMWDNVLGTLSYLETRLPRGSHVMIIGLADGRILYNNLHKRLHPIGLLNRDVTYPEFYTFLSCLETNPCAGWLTTNETLRDLTSERAAELSQVLSQVAKTHQHTFSNFDVNYIDCPLEPVLKQWEAKHGPNTAYQLIEPVDGFHPNQIAQTLTAEYVWKYLEKNLPHYIGDLNPHNQKIEDIFGDQGGY